MIVDEVELDEIDQLDQLKKPTPIQSSPEILPNPTDLLVGEEDLSRFDLNEYLPESVQNFGMGDVREKMNAMRESGPKMFQPTDPSGLQNFNIRAKVQGFADRPDEQDMIMKQYFGEKGFYRDETGALFIQPDALKEAGLETRPDPEPGKYLDPLRLDALPFMGGMKEVGMDVTADMAGDVTEIVVPMATFLITKGSGAAAAAIRSALMGIFTTVGKFTQEMLEDLAGLNNQEFGEVAMDSLESGALAATFELGTSAVTPAARKLLGPNTTRTKAPIFQEGQLQSTVDPERLAMIERVRKNLGAEPSIGRQVGGQQMNIAGGQQQLIENALLKTERQQQVNRAVSRSADEVVEGVRPGLGEATEQSFNVGLDARLTQSVKQQKDEIKRISGNLDRNLASVEAQLDQTGGAGANLGTEFKEVLGDSLDDFHENANMWYSGVDTHTTPSVPTLPLRNVRDDIVKKIEIREYDKSGKLVTTLPKTINDKTKQLLDLVEQVAPGKGKTPLQTFQAMQSIRSQLKKVAYDPDVLKDIGARNAKKLEQAVTDSMASARKGLSVQAKKALDVADQFYSSNIGKFDNVLFRRLTKNIRASGSVPAETGPMLEALIQSGSYKRVGNILELVKKHKPEMIKDIRKADMDSILEDSYSSIGGYDPKKLQKQILDRSKKKKGNLFRLVHEEDADTIKNLVDQLAAKDANIGNIKLTDPLSVLKNEGIERLEQLANQVPTGDIKTILNKALTQVKNRDKLYQNYDILLKHVQQGGDNALNGMEFILSQKNPNAIRQVKKFLGEGSDEFKQLQQLGIRKLTNKMTAIKDDPLEIFMQGGAMRKELTENATKYTELLGKDRFEGMLGFAKEAQFASTSGSFGGIVAAAIRARPFHNWKKILKFVLVDALFNKLSAADYFTKGILSKGKRKASEFTARAIMQTFASQLDNASSNVIGAINTGGASLGDTIENIDLDQYK